MARRRSGYDMGTRKRRTNSDEGRRSAPKAYNAGRMNRVNSDHNPRGLGPNAMADKSLGLTRRRMRDLVDNNPHIAGARRVIRNNVVGTGIAPQPATEWPELNEKIEQLWRVHSAGVDPDRAQTMADVQGQAIDEIFSAGEVLVVHAVTDKHNGHAGGPVLELVDADLVPMDPLADASNAAAGVRVRQGVEFDESGRRTAYHVLKEHPLDASMFAIGSMTGETDRISIDRADLVFLPRRVKQIRGVPWAVSVYDTVQLEEQFHEAYLMLARIAACLGIYIEGGHGTVGDPNGQLTDAAGDPIERMEPGQIGYLPAGAKINTSGTSVPPPTFAATEEVMLRRMAAGLGISFASLSRDYSKATFSATRAESLEDRKGYRPLQAFIWNRIVRPHYRRCVAYWIASGELELTTEQRAAWLASPEQINKAQAIYPGWEWVNPAQEATAAKIAIESGISSLQAEAASRGHHWRDLIDQRLEAEQYERDQRERKGLPERVPANAADLEIADDTNEDAGDVGVDEQEAAA